KIIPLAVGADAVERAVDVLRAESPFQVKPYAARRVALIATELPSLKPSVMDKTRQILEARLSASGSTIGLETRVPHRTEAVAGAIGEVIDRHDMIIIFGASAVS